MEFRVSENWGYYFEAPCGLARVLFTLRKVPFCGFRV